MPEEDKLNLMIRVNKEDNDYFKVIQKEYKKKGISVSYLFNEILEVYKQNKESKS